MNGKRISTDSYKKFLIFSKKTYLNKKIKLLLSKIKYSNFKVMLANNFITFDPAV